MLCWLGLDPGIYCHNHKREVLRNCTKYSSLFFRLLLLQTLKILRGKQWSEILSHLETWVKHQERRELHIVDAFNTTLQYDNRQTVLREDDYLWGFFWFKLQVAMNSTGTSHLLSYILLSMIMKILFTEDRILKLYTWYVSCWSDCLLMQTDENLYCWGQKFASHKMCQ